MSQQRYASVLLFGAPGVGKGTQGRILGTIPGFFHLSSGDVFRSIDIGSPEGKIIYQYSSRGELVPDDLTVRIWKKALEGQIATAKYKPREDLLVLDGIPRNPNQAELLDSYVDVQLIIHLRCTDEEQMIHRIKRRAIRENRYDDANEDVIRRRFQVYHQETRKVLDYYDPQIIAAVDSLGSPAEVLRSILDYLIPVQNRHFQTHGHQFQ
ncbi:MAG: nucleoside monophosphate kinase [Planctomycetota bacterium]|nr:MAG: nucleoside monophosphate kinase [Planctomycetota bacterium]